MARTSTLAEARSILIESVLLTSSSVYTDSRKDRAIRMVLDRALQITRASQQVNDFTLSKSTRTLDMTASQSEFEARRFMWGFIDDDPVKVITYDSMSRLHADDSGEDQPVYIAFAADDEAHFYPTPDSAYTFKVKWWKPLTDFTVGTGSPGSTTLNVPFDLLQEALWWGGSAAMVHSDPDEVLQSEAWRRFEARMFQLRSHYNPDGGIHIPDPDEYI